MRMTLTDSQVAVLDYSTREVYIVTFSRPTTEYGDIEFELEKMGYDPSNIHYMC